MEPTESVKKNLTVILDAVNPMPSHVANFCCVCYYHLQELRMHLTHEMAVKSNKYHGKQPSGLLPLPALSHKKDKYFT